MATTLQQIQTRGVDYNVANRGASLVPANSVFIDLVDKAQQDIFVRLAQDSRVFYQTDEVMTSSVSTGGSAREIDLSTLDFPLLRLLRLERDEDDEEIALVDIRALDAEYAPRATLSGLTLREVYPDWDMGDPGAVDVRVFYVHGAAGMDVDGDLTQTVTIPDQFTDLLVNRFARYLATKDQGRAEGEIKQLDLDYESRYVAFVSYLDNLAGAQAAGFALPVAEKKK